MTRDDPTFTAEQGQFATTLFDGLASATRRKAQDLWERGHVESIASDRRFPVVARVRDATPRKVYGALGAALGCTCPSYIRCAHVGAVLLEIAARAAPSSDGGDASRVAAPTPDERAGNAARQWVSRLGAESAPEDGTGRTRIAFVLSASSSPRLALARQHRRSSTDPWSAPVLLLAREARELLRRDTGDTVIDEVNARVAWATPPSTHLVGRRGAAVLEAALDSGRLWWSDGAEAPIAVRRGDPVEVRLCWRRAGAQQFPAVALGADTMRLIRLAPSFVVDPGAGEVHVAEAGGRVDRIDEWLRGPSIADSEVAAIAAALPAGFPRPTELERLVVRAPLRARLHLYEPHADGGVDRRADLHFTYDDASVHPRTTTDPFYVREAHRERELFREREREQEVLRAVAAEGFIGRHLLRGAHDPHALALDLPDEAAWIAFLLEGAPRLREQGVEVAINPSFKLELVEVDDWYTELEEESETDWFGVELGIRVKGERVSLLPLLVKAFERPANHDAATIVVALPDGRCVPVPRARIEPLVDLIMELAASGKGARPRVSRLHAADLAQALRLQGATLDAIRSLRETLANASSMKLVAPPRRLQATMRDYQRVGLSWLALLAAHGVGGILADDMGLGKTIQVIALLCLGAQQRRRADRAPSLVVAPRSVLMSWTDQLVAFAPHLDVRVWHGADRWTWGADFGAMDVVVTTYQLLQRDIEVFEEQRWSVVVLDEAQAIKNAKSIKARAAMKLRSEVRFALTGTPLENHLGELWSIVQFVAPGALGDDRAFRAAFRAPIEKGRDERRLAALRRRLAPMLLRRTKEQVATELPPKTIIAHRVELGDAQRDLYEAVRQTAAKRVRDEIARRGISQAKIMILDALLKLRQVCCDPRLLKSKTAKAAVESAKLEAFEELLTTLVDEGRRVLVFSQFVEMLDLLEDVLAERGIARARITGSTRDREGEVRRFQSGTVPVFLISLKAGGTGLTLTAADTVIHYDPWWNPAVEAQATDRAHRIGQDKPVFVHRLLTVGTIEEKIAELQEKKGALARGVLEGGGAAFDLDESTVAELLAPLPR